jgi:hypothetical protein
MDFPPFHSPFDPPPDPAYLRFLKGLKEVTADPAGKETWRWHGREGKWYVYDTAKFGMEDFGAADTSPQNALFSQWGIPHSKWVVNEFQVPDLFGRLQKAYTALVATHPKAANLVWSPWGGGDWRNAFERPPGVPPPTTKPPPQPPPACMKRIEDVQAYERSGVITHDQAQRLIEKIVAECT